MTARNIILTLPLLFGIQYAQSVSAHPENSPLTFIPHTTKDGQVIYTNLSMRCFRNDLLICTDRHPIFYEKHKHTKPTPETAN